MGGDANSPMLWLQRYRDVATLPVRARQVLTVLTLTGLAIASFFAVRSLPADERMLEVGWLLVLLGLASPLGLAVNLVELTLISRILGVRFTRGERLQVSLMAMIANLLPLPGAVLVRMNALRLKGVPTARATRVLLGVGTCWLGVASALAMAVVLAPNTALGLLFLACAIAAAGITSVLLRTLARPNDVVWLVLVEASVVVVGALRFFVAFRAFGATVGFARTIALSSSGAIASAIGFAPGGLGLKEAIATALGSALELRAAETFLASALDRAAMIVSLIPLSALALLAIRRLRRIELPLEGHEAAQ